MVLGWVNERNLKDFFDILAARNRADEGRLAFWSRYLKQITWTRLVFSADTMALKSRNPGIRDLIAREEGAYAELTAKRDVDAFMMQIGSYLIIEFSKKPNACYVYVANSLPFKPYDRYYTGGTDDLANGYHRQCAARIVHREGWEFRAADELSALGIWPDRPVTHRSQPSTTGALKQTGKANPEDSRRESTRGPDLADLKRLVNRYDGAQINDMRASSGGRHWVEDSRQNASLATELKAHGLRWADKRQAWYYPEK